LFCVGNGHATLGYDTSVEQRSRLVGAGFRMAECIKEALAGRKIVLPSLPDPKAVRDAWLGADGIISNAEQASLCIEARRTTRRTP
jgi:3-hydroxyisobutyrate dehydrogenase-like beta-hydroxyacid dehydrogenase